MHVQIREFKKHRISANLGVWFTRIGKSQDAKKHAEIKSNHKKCTTSFHVDLSVIGLAGEDAPADLAVRGGEEDLRCLEMEPEVLLRCDGGYRRWSSSGELCDAEAEVGQERQRTMLT